MAKTNWTLTDTVKPADMNSIGQEINDLNTKVSKIDLTANLGPSTSVITADQASDLDLTVYGNTIVNLLGADGNFEVDSNGDGVADGWVSGGSGTRTLETSAKYGLKAQRIAATAGDSAGSYRYMSKKGIPVYAGKRYVAIIDMTNDGTSRARFAMYKAGAATTYAAIAPTTSSVLYLKFTPTSDDLAEMWLYNDSPIGTVGWVQFDGAGLYEVPESLYNRIGVDITESNIRDYLPHVDGRQHVQGVAITKQGKNLLPPFSSQEWTLHANAKVKGPYELELNATAWNQDSYVTVDALPNQAYVFSLPGAKIFKVSAIDANNVQTTLVNDSLASQVAFSTLASAKKIRITLRQTTQTGINSFTNPQLELGSTATTFEPAEPQRLILPVTLASTPDGLTRDRAYYRDGAWRLLKCVDTSVTPAVALANPVESVIANAEGAITLHPGGNQISVETGVIQREKVVSAGANLYNGRYFINTVPATKFQYRTSRILQVYKGADIDTKWSFNAHSASNIPTYGNYQASILATDFDPNATYYVTYITLDKYAYTANVTQVDAKYTSGLSGAVSGALRDVARLAADNDRQDFADTYIQAAADNLRYDVNQSLGYGVTTNSGNAYSVTIAKGPTTLAEGVRVAVKINVDSTGAATLNVNGLGAKAIKKANGNDATNLKAGSVYTLVYNGTAFILQGEGGEIGTATAGDVRASKTIGGDTLVTGTLPVQATAAQTITPGTTNIVKAAGIYDGPITVLGDADLVPGNIPKDTNLFGVQGSLERLTTADKQSIADAITGKGVAASVSDAPATLATKIGQIYQGKKFYEANLGTIASTGLLPFSLSFFPKVLTVTSSNLNGSTSYTHVLFVQPYGGIKDIQDGGFLNFQKSDGSTISVTDVSNGSLNITNFRVANSQYDTWYNVTVRAWE